MNVLSIVRLVAILAISACLALPTGVSAQALKVRVGNTITTDLNSLALFYPTL